MPETLIANALQLRYAGLYPFGQQVEHHDAGPGLAESAGTGGTDTLSRAGDRRYLSIQL